jgi:16S rRNA (uracil1498-N3)-methyltransferase
MIRLFIEDELTVENTIKSTKTHYLCNVMRCNIGQSLILVNGRDGEFRGEITKITKQFVEIHIVEQTKVFKSNNFLGLIFPPIQKIELVAKSATELGVTEFIPFISKFCQSKFKGDKFLLNVIEAVEQSERIDIPKISTEGNLKSILDRIALEKTSTVFFCEERSKTNFDIKKQDFSETKYYALIGPEGGFAEEEKDMIKNYDFIKSISLGENILRTETACSSILSIINYWRI